MSRYAMCAVRLGNALVLSGEVSEAARVLGDAASQTHLYPRLVKELDAQLHAYGLDVP
jgi:hypothetical protein